MNQYAALDLINWARQCGRTSALFTPWGWREANAMDRSDIVMTFGGEEASFVEAVRMGAIRIAAAK